MEMNMMFYWSIRGTSQVDHAFCYVNVIFANSTAIAEMNARQTKMTKTFFLCWNRYLMMLTRQDKFSKVASNLMFCYPFFCS